VKCSKEFLSKAIVSDESPRRESGDRLIALRDAYKSEETSMRRSADGLQRQRIRFNVHTLSEPTKELKRSLDTS